MSYSNGPKLVTNGLVLYLDAANPKSYIGSGTTWNDLSGTKNGTLTNSPTYNTSSKGSIVFDGIDDYIAIPSDTFGYSTGTTGELSLEAWVYPTGPFSSYTNEPPTTNLGGIFGQGYFGGYAGWGLGMSTISGVGTVWNFQVRNNGGIIVDGAFPLGYNGGVYSTFTTGSWYHIVGSFTRNDKSRFYVNGTLVASTSSVALNNQSLTPTVNNAAIGRGGIGPFQFGGRISVAKLYNRPLSSQEILQNYNSTKGRFGL